MVRKQKGVVLKRKYSGKVSHRKEETCREWFERFGNYKGFRKNSPQRELEGGTSMK